MQSGDKGFCRRHRVCSDGFCFRRHSSTASAAGVAPDASTGSGSAPRSSSSSTNGTFLRTGHTARQIDCAPRLQHQNLVGVKDRRSRARPGNALTHNAVLPGGSERGRAAEMSARSMARLSPPGQRSAAPCCPPAQCPRRDPRTTPAKRSSARHRCPLKNMPPCAAYAARFARPFIPLCEGRRSSRIRGAPSPLCTHARGRRLFKPFCLRQSMFATWTETFQTRPDLPRRCTPPGQRNVSKPIHASHRPAARVPRISVTHTTLKTRGGLPVLF